MCEECPLPAGPRTCTRLREADKRQRNAAAKRAKEGARRVQCHDPVVPAPGPGVVVCCTRRSNAAEPQRHAIIMTLFVLATRSLALGRWLTHSRNMPTPDSIFAATGNDIAFCVAARDSVTN